MRHVNWGNVESKADGESKRLAAGPYVAKIVTMEDRPEKEYVELVFDIAEGPDAGHYSDKWGTEHPFAHHVFLSYKDTALGALKGRLEAIQASNPGFDPFAAWDAGRLDMFYGRLLGVNLQEEEYMQRDGDVGMRFSPFSPVVPVQDVRDGKIKVLAPKKLDGTQAAPKPSTAAAVTEDNGYKPPFD